MFPVAGAPGESPLRLFVAEFVRHGGDAPVGHRILHGFGGRLELLVRGDILPVQHIADSGLFAERGRLHGALQGALRVDSPDTFHHRVADDRYAAVAGHLVGLAADQRPDRKLALLVADREHRRDHVAHPVALDDRKPRMQRPVSVPAREGRIVRPIGFADFIVVAAEFTVHVAVGRGGDHRVVHGRIEDALGAFVRSRDLDALQFLFPCVAGRRHHLAEIPVGNLFAQVFQRIVGAYGRNGDFQCQFLDAAFEADHALHAFAFQLAASGRLVVVEDQQFGDRTVAFQCEVDAVFRRPAFDDAVADDGVGIDQP